MYNRYESDIMEIEIKELSKKDHKKAIKWAIDGMHLNRYVDEGFALNMYGKYFWYLELMKATQVIAAYYDNICVGVMLANMENEKKVYYSFFKKIFVNFVDWIQNTFFTAGVDSYNEANIQMLKEYKEKVKVDGEIVFLAADSNSKVKGIGTKILEEFEKREKGKRVYLYTDDSCTYQFYDHRGFERVKEKSITLNLNNKQVPITCMLYSKKII